MEPELGVGIVDAVDGRRIHLRFPESGLTRIYAAATAPLQRVAFHPGDRVTGEDGTTLTIAAVAREDGLNVYCGDGRCLREDRLGAGLAVNRPNDRIMAGQRDASRLFDLRVSLLGHRANAARSPVHGFVGGRIAPIAHQLAVAAEVSARRFPRVMLADETGLGKTIEAGLILHRLTILGRVARVLVVVPDALVVQWYVELARRFNLRCRIVDDAFMGDRPQRGEDPFADEPLILCGFSLLADAPTRRWDRLVADGWDMVVVDEAHRLQPGGARFAQVERLAATVDSLILITATPGHLSAWSHFARLRLLDPHRYPDYGQFRRENRGLEQIARLAEAVAAGDLSGPDTAAALAGKLGMPPAAVRRVASPSGGAAEDARRRLIQRLIDRHGTGRVMFRTRRRSVPGFPGRRVALVPIAAPVQREKETRSRLNREFFQDSTPVAQPQALDLEDDCRVAWLADYLHGHRREKILLICRTSRKVTALAGALEKLTRRKIGLFHEGMTLVQRDRHAAWFAEPDGAQLLICSEIGSEGRNFQFARHLVLFDLPTDAELLEQRIGRLDRIGQTGVVTVTVPFVPGTAGEVMARWYHEALDAFAVHVPAAAWVTQRFLGALTPDHGYAQPLPGFRPSGLTATTERATALTREDVDFLTWDHPLVIGATDLFLGSGRGNAAFIHLKTSAQPLFLLEMIFVAEAAGPPRLCLERFLPPTPIRVVVDGELRDGAAQFPDTLPGSAGDGSADLLAAVLSAVSRRLPDMVDAGRSMAQARAAKIVEASRRSAEAAAEEAVGRLEALRQAHPALG
ncbi:MAG TPA: RNA polymerase-associated protein RapA, partial [Desulfosarcina sp.]|nr:RNA polymerase-associated protein RapA [Desulfosarcina sp.]